MGFSKPHWKEMQSMQITMVRHGGAAGVSQLLSHSSILNRDYSRCGLTHVHLGFLGILWFWFPKTCQEVNL